MVKPINSKEFLITVNNGERVLFKLTGLYEIESSRVINTSIYEIPELVDFDTSIFITYKNYRGIALLDDSGDLFTGQVEQINPVITFQGRTITQIVIAFFSSIEMYHSMCKEDGVIPA